MQYFPEIAYLDGELVYDKHNKETWGRTSSIVMSYDKVPTGICYKVFDYIPATGFYVPLFCDRLKILKRIRDLKTIDPNNIIDVVSRYRLVNHAQLRQLMDKAILEGYEGIMLNELYSLYKHGRCTNISGQLIKCKRWDYDESEVVALEEYYTNIGDPERGRDGIIRRSKIQDNLVGMGILGSLVLSNGLRVGTGFTDSLRKVYWNNDTIGKVCRYKYLPSVGKLARHPVFVSLGSKE